MVVTGECRLLHTCEMCEFNNDTDCKADKNEHNRWLVNKRMGDIKFKLIIGSNKGGVGKSTVTTNLAIALVGVARLWRASGDHTLPTLVADLLGTTPGEVKALLNRVREAE